MEAYKSILCSYKPKQANDIARERHRVPAGEQAEGRRSCPGAVTSEGTERLDGWEFPALR